MQTCGDPDHPDVARQRAPTGRTGRRISGQERRSSDRHQVRSGPGMGALLPTSPNHTDGIGRPPSPNRPALRAQGSSVPGRGHIAGLVRVVKWERIEPPSRTARRCAPESKLPRALARPSASSDSRLPFCERGARPPFTLSPRSRRQRTEFAATSFSPVGSAPQDRVLPTRVKRGRVRERRSVLPVGAFTPAPLRDSAAKGADAEQRHVSHLGEYPSHRRWRCRSGSTGPSLSSPPSP